jgi:hypothetical protein
VRLLAEWLDAHTGAAPPVLRERVRDYVRDTASADSAPPHAQTLASAGAAALAAVTTHPGDRSAALDLLAADALITLALLEQAERDPAGLAALAAELLRRHGSAT